MMVRNVLPKSVNTCIWLLNYSAAGDLTVYYVLEVSQWTLLHSSYL